MSPIEVLIPITAILVAGTAIILPIAGITARFALKPVVEAIAKMKAAGGVDVRSQIMEQRLSLVEEQLHALERENARLLEEAEFHRQLGAPWG